MYQSWNNLTPHHTERSQCWHSGQLPPQPPVVWDPEAYHPQEVQARGGYGKESGIWLCGCFQKRGI